MASLSPSTVVMTWAVPFMVTASRVVLSTFSPASFLVSTPVSSMKALRVPEPASRDTTVMLSAQATAAVSVRASARIRLSNFFMMNPSFLFRVRE